MTFPVSAAEGLHLPFVLSVGDTPTDAGSLPTAVLYENGVAGDAVTVTALDGDGEYKATPTIPAGASSGDRFAVRVAAVVSSVPRIIWLDAGRVTPATPTAGENAVAVLELLEAQAETYALPVETTTTSPDTVNEGSDSVLTVSFKGFSGQAETPTAVSYRIDDVESGAEVLEDTVWAGTLASTIEIDLTATDNRIIGSNKKRRSEKRKVTVTATFSGGGTHQSSHTYSVKNNRFKT